MSCKVVYDLESATLRTANIVLIRGEHNPIQLGDLSQSESLLIRAGFDHVP